MTMFMAMHSSSDGRFGNLGEHVIEGPSSSAGVVAIVYNDTILP